MKEKNKKDGTALTHTVETVIETETERQRGIKPAKKERKNEEETGWRTPFDVSTHACDSQATTNERKGVHVPNATSGARGRERELKKKQDGAYTMLKENSNNNREGTLPLTGSVPW